MLAWRIKPVSLPLRSPLSMQPAAGSEWRRTRKKEHSIKCGLILVSTAAASLGCCNRIWRPSKCREVILLRRSGGGVHKSKFNIVSFMCGWWPFSGSIFTRLAWHVRAHISKVTYLGNLSPSPLGICAASSTSTFFGRHVSQSVSNQHNLCLVLITPFNLRLYGSIQEIHFSALGQQCSFNTSSSISLHFSWLMHRNWTLFSGTGCWVRGVP